MPALPPADLVFDALKQVVIPAAGTAALATGLILALGRWAGSLAAAVGVLAGVAFANWQQGNAARLPWTPGEKAGSDWLLPAMLVLVGTGLLSRWLGLLVGRYWTARRGVAEPVTVWLPRVAAVFVVSGWVLPAKLLEEEPNLRAAVGGVMLLTWLAADTVARRGASGQVVAYLSACALTAGGVMLFAHSGKFTDIASMVGMALFGVAVIGGVARADVSGAIPAAVAFLPGFLAGGRFVSYSKVPVECFVLAACAPLVLLPFLVPALGRRNGVATRLARLVLILIPLAVAVLIANQHEVLAFDEEW